MNRDFDFRVWHLPTGQMVYDININNDFVARNWNHDLTDEQNYKIVYPELRREDCLIMQYSGILDCDGNKVWEGDIIHFEHEAENEQGQNVLMSWYYEVTFLKGAFVTLNQSGAADALIDLTATHPADAITARVAGNMFEHAHLLELSADYVHTPKIELCYD